MATCMVNSACSLLLTSLKVFFASAHVKSNNAEYWLTEGWSDNRASAITTSSIILTFHSHFHGSCNTKHSKKTDWRGNFMLL
jgi:hypothetical protein